MISSRNVELLPWYGQRLTLGGFNQFLARENRTLSQHFLEKKKKTRCMYSLQPGYIEVEQNYRDIKRKG